MNAAFQDGFNAVIQSTGGVIGDAIGQSYANRINQAIKDFEDDINQFKGYNTPTGQLNGDCAELWTEALLI